MKIVLTIVALALLAVYPAKGEVLDSLTICLQSGDSCMQQYNTAQALKYYQQAYDLAKKRSQEKAVEHLNLPQKHLEKLPQERQNEIYHATAHKTQKRNEMTCYENSLQDIKVMLKKNTGYMSSEQFRRVQDDIQNYIDNYN